jgi:hypothetical protein
MNYKSKIVEQLVKNKRDGDITIIENVSKRDRSALEKALAAKSATIIVVKS